MRIALIADGRSPITRSWISNILPLGHELHLISSYPCDPIPGIVSIQILPLAFSGISSSIKRSSEGKRSSALYQRLRLWMLAVRSFLGPISLLQISSQYRRAIVQIKPDLVHALRIPFEGMAAAATPAGVPLIVSSWGNDFTLHADSSPLMRWATTRCLRRANGFMADCLRDIKLAKVHGLAMDTPTMFAPGNGGFDLTLFEELRRNAPEDRGNKVINPRGIRPAYVRNDIFFEALSDVIQTIPDVLIECAGMDGQIEAEKWVRQYPLDGRVDLLPVEKQSCLWERFTQSSVVVSPATHDGTPNSVLEAMALGCLPVVGDIESLREWITDGVNGILVDPNDARSIADGIIRGLRDGSLRQSAQKLNWELICEKADTAKTRDKINYFYNSVALKTY